MITTAQIAVTDPSVAALVFESTPQNSNVLCIQNTGTVTVLLGSDTAQVYPLAANGVLQFQVAPDDALYAVLQTSGTAGQITILGVA